MKKKSKIKSVKIRSATQERYTSGVEEVVKVTGLIRRGSTYSLRRRVPTDLVVALGKTEIWIALGTSEYKAAAKEARLASVRLDLQWEKQRQALTRGEKINPDDRLSAGELRRAVIGDFWVREQSASITVEDEERREDIEREIGGLETRDPSAEAVLFAQARSIIRERKLKVPLPAETTIGGAKEPFVPSDELRRLLELIRRADVEHLKRMIDRLEGAHGDQTHDPLFEGVNSISAAPAQSEGVTLGEAITRMQNDPTRAHLGDTADAKYVVTFRAMKELLGDDKPLAAITRAECAAVQELIAGLPANVAKLKAYKSCATMREMVETAATRTDRMLSPTTVKVYTHTLSAFFNWAIGKGLLTLNPAVKLAGGKKRAKNARRPWKIDALNIIIAGLPAWSRKSESIGRYWVPLIALFSGMRLGEIVGLTVDDVEKTYGEHCFVLWETDEQEYKTPGSERVIPVHPELVRLGLLDLVEKTRKAGGRRLFPELPGKDQDQLSDLFQKRFSYWLTSKLNIKQRGLSFHSLRHNFRDALRENGVPIDSTRALGGWSRSGIVEERYGAGVSVRTLAKWVAEISYDGLNPLGHLQPVATAG
ncbi:site-specific integrase [Rhizobium lusitanum]|uniref:site-specific integrase n=1 Tax=Rhizobium lusitanum TaxID=293958 RepID=UPI00195A6BCD|nr:site-specific integrase [Rhizobium lusitanum]MBM7049716.1 site-specific integrase [Rhizobium lusitanum]